MEAMKIMGIPDEEQMGMNLLRGLKMQGNEKRNQRCLPGVFCAGVLSLQVLGFSLTLFCLLSNSFPCPASEQCTSNKLSGFGVTHLRIYQQVLQLALEVKQLMKTCLCCFNSQSEDCMSNF